MAAILSVCNFLAILFTDDLRRLEFYPVALLSVVDIITCSFAFPLALLQPAYGDYLKKYEYVKTNYDDFFEQQNSFFHLQDVIHLEIIKFTEIVNEHNFIFRCVPLFFLMRVNEFCYGTVMFFNAYERYILILRPNESKKLLSAKRRRKVSELYVLLSLFDCSSGRDRMVNLHVLANFLHVLTKRYIALQVFLPKTCKFLQVNHSTCNFYKITLNLVDVYCVRTCKFTEFPMRFIALQVFLPKILTR